MSILINEYICFWKLKVPYNCAVNASIDFYESLSNIYVIDIVLFLWTLYQLSDQVGTPDHDKMI